MDKLSKGWVVERDNALETRNVDELIKFMEKWEEKGLYNSHTVEEFKKAPEQVKIGTMCKMIMNCTKISRKTKKWAKEKLDEMGWSYEIY